MRRVALILVLSILVKSLSAQDELINRIIRQQKEIDSLTAALKFAVDQGKLQVDDNARLKDSLKWTRQELSQLVNFKKQRKEFDQILKVKQDSILHLEELLSLKEKNIENERQNCIQRAKQEGQKGRQEVLLLLSNYYKGKTFDELVNNLTKQTIDRDYTLLQDMADVRALLVEIKKCHYAKEVLDSRYDRRSIDSATAQLLTVQRGSMLANDLREILSNYKVMNDGLKKSIMKIRDLDSIRVKELPQALQKEKSDRINMEVSSYIFNYGLKLEEYPYLASVVLELLRRKRQNPDNPIEDLLEKL